MIKYTKYDKEKRNKNIFMNIWIKFYFPCNLVFINYINYKPFSFQPSTSIASGSITKILISYICPLKLNKRFSRTEPLVATVIILRHIFLNLPIVEGTTLSTVPSSLSSYCNKNCFVNIFSIIMVSKYIPWIQYDV